VATKKSSTKNSQPVINPALAMALTKSVGGKAADAAREALAPGEYMVDAAVQLQGVLVVGEDTTKTATSSILNQAFVALCLHHAGITREGIATIMQRVAADYLAGWVGSPADREVAETKRAQLIADLGLEDQLAMIQQMVAAQLPPIPVRGRVSFKGSVNVLDPTAEQEADEVLAATGTEG